jgi:hypothetical protein
VRPESVGRPANGDRGAAPAPLSREAPRWHRALVGLAATLQVIIMALTFVSGMLWPGWPYLVANVVAILGLVLIRFIGTRTGRPTALIAQLAAPFVSVALILGLVAFDEWRVARAACNDRELKAVAGLESPSGQPLTFQGSYDGCEARADLDLPREEVTTVYAATLREAGWTVTNRTARKDSVTLWFEPLNESDVVLMWVEDDEPWQRAR